MELYAKRQQTKYKDMCKEPLMIKNRCKYLNNKHGQPYYIWVNCGKCSECIEQKTKEWTLRTYYQAIDCLTQNKDNFIYFDTLTYRNENLPRITNYIESNKNWACFNYKDIRNFYENLRSYYKKGQDRKIIFFITSEYGEIRNRPHYHILLFVYDGITNPIELSKNVSKAWKYGRTDGIPYKSHKYILEHNTMNKINLDIIRYVAKYVNKSCKFTEVVNKRWCALEKYYEKTKFDKKQIAKIRKQYFRLTTPFHRQSQHFGECAINYMSLKDIIETNQIYYKDDSLKINQYCSLPMYFKRKLFQEQKELNGKKYWTWTELGKQYKKHQETIILEKLTDRLNDLNRQLQKNYTIDQLKETAYYILFERGRLNGEIDYNDHNQDAEYYNYCTDKDEIYLGHKMITKNYHGNDKVGYCEFKDEVIDLKNLTCQKSHLDAIIEDLRENEDIISINLLKEHLQEIRKIFFQK